MAEYEPPRCEDPGCKALATSHVHIDADHYVEYAPVTFLCQSHQRRLRAVLIKARIPFEAFSL